MALVLLAVGGVAAAFVSDWFVAALGPSLETLHLSEAFAGHRDRGHRRQCGRERGRRRPCIEGAERPRRLGGEELGQPDRAVPLPGARPAVAAASRRTSRSCSQPVYIGALGITALALWQITGDGEAYAFEGWGLISLYVIVAVFAYFE